MILVVNSLVSRRKIFCNLYQGYEYQVLLQVLIIHLVPDKKAAEDLRITLMEKALSFPPVEDEKGKISSTRIRQAILDGNVKETENFGGTTSIKRYGGSWQRSWSYDWLSNSNLVLLDHTYMPTDGVYVVDVEIQRQKYRAMASVGKM